jgi:hypothetical protein
MVNVIAPELMGPICSAREREKATLELQNIIAKIPSKVYKSIWKTAYLLN